MRNVAANRNPRVFFGVFQEKQKPFFLLFLLAKEGFRNPTKDLGVHSYKQEYTLSKKCSNDLCTAISKLVRTY